VAGPQLGCRTWVRVLRAPWPCRSVFGDIPDVDVPPPVESMDVAVWLEVHLDG
jgi:hypothetical protein